MSTPAAEPEVELLQTSAVEALTRGEIDIQIATAKRFPRSLKSFKDRALEMATLDQETAESCIYALPRDGKTIEGPSARLAEILASAYGNMRIEGRPVGDDGKFITARGTAFDIQNNVLIAFETQRRITGKNGRRFSEDMVGVTSNAATSIAIRNAVLKVVPKAFWGPIYEACRKAAVGDASTLVNRRAAMLEYFLKMGVLNERVFTLLNVKGVEDITLDHLGVLKGLATAIKEGDTTVDEAFAIQIKEPAARADLSKPAGYEHWLDDMTAVADEGDEKLMTAFKASSQAHREYLTTNEAITWESLKARAAKAAKTAATPTPTTAAAPASADPFDQPGGAR